MSKQFNKVDIRMQDDLIALVAGTLAPNDFDRVASAVADDPSLQQALKHLEMIHASMLRNDVTADDPSAVAATTERVLKQISIAPAAPVKTGSLFIRLRDLAPWLHATWIAFSQPERVRWAYGAVAAQAVVILILATNAMPWKSEETSAMRSGSGPTDSKQLGLVPGHTLFTVNFSAETTEATFRALLLEIQAEIVSGPNQLGQYRISVARNRSDLAQRRLKESQFVEQVSELKQ